MDMMKTLKKLHETLPPEEYRVVEHLIAKANFDEICDRADWKGPIDKVVGVGPGVTPEFIKWVVSYFTATETTVIDLLNGRFLVQSIGYRAGPAGP